MKKKVLLQHFKENYLIEPDIESAQSILIDFQIFAPLQLSISLSVSF